MDLKLKPYEWADGEAYTVHIDGGGERVSEAVGHLWRSAPGVFSFVPGDTFDPSIDECPKIQCDTAAEAAVKVADNLKLVELPKDRLSNAQMYGIAGQHLVTIAALAKATDSRPGYISALASAVARSIVIDLRPESEEAFMKAFIDEVVTNIKGQRAIGSAGEALAAAFAVLFKRDEETPDETTGPKHH